MFVDYLHKGHTMNGEYYDNLLRELQKVIKTKYQRKLPKGVLFTRQSLVSMAVVRDFSYKLAYLPLYSLDLALSDYHVLRKRKDIWRRTSNAVTLMSYLLLMPFITKRMKVSSPN